MSDFAETYAVQPDPLAAHARLNRTIGALVASVDPKRFGDPTPCGNWDVRRVVSHLSDTNDVYATLADTGSMPENTPEYVDPVAAFAVQAARAESAFAAAGYLDEVRPTPVGPVPGRVVVQHAINELLTHGWDLARGIGATTDIEPEIAVNSLAAWQAFFAHYPREQMEFNFAAERPAAPGATNADRVAAYLGRE